MLFEVREDITFWPLVHTQVHIGQHQKVIMEKIKCLLFLLCTETDSFYLTRGADSAPLPHFQNYANYS